MAAKRPRRGKSTRSASDRAPQEDGAKPAEKSSATVVVRKVKDEEAWELVHPRCARDRQLDLEEVQSMIDAGEMDVAIDECRWLLDGCSDFIEAHRTLGELALGENDLPLARGHFGYAYRVGTQALDRAGIRGPLPYRFAANRAFLESGKGLAYCLVRLDKRPMAEEVVARLLACDPDDPLGVAGLLTAES